MANKLNIDYPDLQVIINRINKHKKFSFVKISVEFWMLMSKALRRMKADTTVLNKKHLQSDAFLQRLAKTMVIEWSYQSKGRPWKVSSESFYRIVKMIASTKPKDFVFGVTDMGHPTEYPVKEPFLQNRQNVAFFLNKVLDDDLIVYSAAGWKQWSFTGEIHKFFMSINHNRIAVVGPSHLENFGSKINAAKFDYIEIPSKDACLHVEDISKTILEHNKNTTEYTVYLVQGGAAAMDFMDMIHNQMTNCCVIDIGRSLDTYYYYDPIKKQLPNWYWGTWLSYDPPTWLKNI